MKILLQRIWYSLCKYVLIVLPMEAFFRFTFWVTCKRLGRPYYKLNLQAPRSFNEKLNYLKLHTRYPQAGIVADKYRVRDYVKARIGEQYLVPLLGVYKRAEDIPFESLPDAFVLKTNHGSGWNIICNHKQALNIPRTIRKLNRWLSYNAYYLSREYQYKDIPPLIICEEMLQYNIEDYKFFCFNGEPRFVQVDVGRFTQHERAYFDLRWQQLPFSICYPKVSKEIQPPAQLEDMIAIAKKLSAGFIFSRIDLYIHNDVLFFGEITLFPEGGKGPFLEKIHDFKVGELLDLAYVVDSEKIDK